MLYYSYDLSGPAYPLVRARYVKMSTARYNIEKRRRRRNERDKKKETKDEKGKWRKMHRLIKKTIELFYMDTFKSRLQCERRSCSKTYFTVQLVHKRRRACLDRRRIRRPQLPVYFFCPVNVEKDVKDGCLSYCIERKTKHTRTSTSSRTGLTQILQSIRAYFFDGASLLSVTNRRRNTTNDVGHTLRQFRCGFCDEEPIASCREMPVHSWMSSLSTLASKSCMAHMTLLFWNDDLTLFCFWSFSPAAWNLRIVFGTRDCNDVLHTLGGSYLFYKRQVPRIMSTFQQKK